MNKKPGELLIDKYCNELVDYINEHTTLLVAIIDEDFNLFAGNKAFRNILGLKKEDDNVAQYLRPTTEKEFFMREKRWRGVKIKAVPHASLYYNLVANVLYIGEGRYIFIGENALLTHEEILHKFTILNNELTNITRELSKKNAALEEANQKVNRLLRTDPMTGIANRRSFTESLEKALSAKRRHEVTLSMVFVDLNRFKEINDTYGHKTGDEVLIDFARYLECGVRKEDLAARLGGDEFAILLLEATIKQAETLTKRLYDNLKLHKFSKKGLSLLASFGVAEATADDSVDSLMQKADEALYTAKKSKEIGVAITK